jgi:DNA-binding NarL/FixJ family response regulator
MGFVHGIVLRDLNELSRAEKKLLEVYADNPGKSFHDIAEMMEISPKSVAKYSQSIREKLYVNSLAEAVNMAGVKG